MSHRPDPSCSRNRSTRLRRLRSVVHAIAGSIAIATTAIAAPASAAETTGWLDLAHQEMRKIWQQGDEGLYLPLYTYHKRSTYTPEKIAELNEFTWGIGYHRSYRDDSGNYRGLFGMGLSDSHRDLQLTFGYTYERVWHRMGDIEFRAGIAAMIIRRTDLFGGVPFPGALPMLAAGTRNFHMTLTHIPSFSKDLNDGDVTFLMGSYKF
jgi:lipid IVA palmitoyltransferase